MGVDVIHAVFLYFASYLRSVRKITSNTIDGYITHVSVGLLERGQPQVDMRSCQLKYLLAAWKREDESKAPQRLRIKIPLSADLMWRLFDLLEVWFGRAPDFLRLYVAAFSLGFGLGLRPGEYLQPSLNSSLPVASDDVCLEVHDDTRTPNHALHGESCFFKWADDDQFYSCLHPSLYPGGQPVAFVALLDSSKNDAVGKGGPRAVYSAPVGSKFDCVANIFAFLRRCPPAEGGYILSGLQGQPITSKDINRALKLFACHVNLDPSRLLPHSVRVGSSSQTDGMPLHDRMQHTNHRSVAGLLAYYRKPLQLAQRSAAFIHDVSVHTLEAIKLTYMTPQRS